MLKYILLLHIISATIWTGGHLILTITILPKILKNKDTDALLQFEDSYEKIGIPALIIQIISGFWLAYLIIPDIHQWFTFDNALSTTIVLKLILLLLTLILATDSRLRIIPNLSKSNLNSLAIHIILVTIISTLFVLVGVFYRFGGLL